MAKISELYSTVQVMFESRVTNLASDGAALVLRQLEEAERVAEREKARELVIAPIIISTVEEERYGPGNCGKLLLDVCNREMN